MHPSLIPNVLLRILKWPTAILSICALPFAFDALWSSPLAEMGYAQAEWFLMGAGGYWLGWFFLFRKRFMGSYLSTFEHELTHAIFAWLTLHRVTGLSVTWRQGGACTYEGSGGGNWLISIAPYWFPTVALPILLVAAWTENLQGQEVQLLLGIAVSYQITSTWRETHVGQTDLQKTTWLFAGLFIPTANLLTYGAILLWTLDSSTASTDYLQTVWSQTIRWLMETFGIS